MKIMKRSGFTLVELLVVIGVLMIITALTVTAYNASVGGDRLRGAARTTQSAFLGAKDRALHAKDRRGVRLLRDSGDGSLCNGFCYLQPIEMQTYAEHSLRLERRDDSPQDNTADSGDIMIVRGNTTLPIYPMTDWYTISGYFSNPPRMRIPAGTGQWYTFTWATSGVYAFTQAQQVLQLTTPWAGTGTIAFPDPRGTDYSDAGFSCDIEMAPEVLPNHAPIQLPSGVVIDLYYSQIPATWYSQHSVANGTALGTGEVDEGTDPSNAANNIYRTYVPNMELMYSPRGVITGAVSAQGPIHLLLRDIQDATQGLNPIDQRCKGEVRVLSVFPQTGHVQVFEYDPTDADANGYADQPFRFALQGSRAGN